MFDKVKISQNIISAFLTQGVHYISSFLVGILVIRYLNPSSYGILTFAIAIQVIIQSVTFLGSSVILPLLSDKPFTLRKVASSLISLSTYLNIITAITATIISIVINQFNWAFTIIILSLIPSSLLILRYFNNSLGMNQKNLKAKLISSVISIVIKLLFVVLDLGLNFIALAYFLDVIIMGLILYSSQKSDLILISYKGARRILKPLRSKILLNIFLNISALLYIRIDQLIIPQLLSIDNLGYYGAYTKIYDAIVMLAYTYSITILPQIKSKIQKLSINQIDYQKFYPYYKKLYFIGILIVLVSIFGEDGIIFLFGNEYEKEIVVYQILVIASIFAGISSLNQKIIVAQNGERILLERLIVSLVINTVLNYILINKIGLKGAAISTLIITFLNAYIFDLIDPRTKKLTISKFPLYVCKHR